MFTPDQPEDAGIAASSLGTLREAFTASAEHQIKLPKPEKHTWMLLEKLWSRLHVDHSDTFNSWGPTSWWLSMHTLKYMYPCIHSTVSTSTKSSFWGARFWHPHKTTSFYSEKFQAWCRERGTTHLTGAPYRPATNGAFMQALCKSALQEFLMANPSGRHLLPK